MSVPPDVQGPLVGSTESKKESSIPDTFIKCPLICCAFRCDHFDCFHCFGCKGNCQCLCIEEEGFCCKMVKERACCICFASSLDIVACPAAMKCYRQCFCVEWICGCPFDGYLNTQVGFREIPTREGAEVTTDSRPCMGVCCSISNLYLSFPGCCSSYQKTSCLCLELESICLKPMCMETTKANKSSLCLLNKAHCFIVSPTTCCKSILQVFCLDNRCAIPCDSEVPCICLPLPFCSLCANWALRVECCASIGELTAEKKT
eukprot:gene18646-21828_t